MIPRQKYNKKKPPIFHRLLVVLDMHLHLLTVVPPTPAPAVPGSPTTLSAGGDPQLTREEWKRPLSSLVRVRGSRHDRTFVRLEFRDGTMQPLHLGDLVGFLALLYMRASPAS
jgi:hypothetical protein